MSNHSRIYKTLKKKTYITIKPFLFLNQQLKHCSDRSKGKRMWSFAGQNLSCLVTMSPEGSQSWLEKFLGRQDPEDFEGWFKTKVSFLKRKIIGQGYTWNNIYIFIFILVFGTGRVDEDSRTVVYTRLANKPASQDVCRPLLRQLHQ